MQEARFLYIGTVMFRWPETRLWVTPFGFFMDLWALHRIYNGWAEEYREVFIDEIFPF